jgi:DNA-binding transcriptional LysR family regulator
MFLQVVDVGTVRGAAAVVHLTQPAVSRNIKLLEEQLGAELFRRQGRGLTLTAAGRALVPRARQLLEASRQAAHEVVRSAERDYFDVRLGVIDSVATFLLPEALAGLRKKFPDLVIRLNTSRTATLLERVRSGDLDLVVVAHEGPPADARASRAGSYDLQFYGCKERFPGLSRATTVEDLASFPVVEIEPPPGTAGAMPPETMSYARASNLATVKAMVLAGFGVGDLVSFTLAPLERKRLVAARIPHSEDCGVYVVGSPNWSGETEQAIENALVEQIARGAKGGRSHRS